MYIMSLLVRFLYVLNTYYKLVQTWGPGRPARHRTIKYSNCVDSFHLCSGDLLSTSSNLWSGRPAPAPNNKVFEVMTPFIGIIL